MIIFDFYQKNGIEWSTIIQIILALLNTGLVVIFFVKNMSYDKKKHNITLTNAWTRDIMLPICIEQIKDIRACIDEVYRADEDFELFYEELLVIQKKINSTFELLKFIDNDISSYYTLYEDFEDNIIDSFFDEKNYDFNNFINKVIIKIYQNDISLSVIV